MLSKKSLLADFLPEVKSESINRAQGRTSRRNQLDPPLARAPSLPKFCTLLHARLNWSSI
jgi:hypothetical protein